MYPNFWDVEIVLKSPSYNCWNIINSQYLAVSWQYFWISRVNTKLSQWTEKKKNYKEIKIRPALAFLSVSCARRHWIYLKEFWVEKDEIQNSIICQHISSWTKAMKIYSQIEDSKNILLCFKKTYSKSCSWWSQSKSKKKYKSEYKGLEWLLISLNQNWIYKCIKQKLNVKSNSERFHKKCRNTYIFTWHLIANISSLHFLATACFLLQYVFCL